MAQLIYLVVHQDQAVHRIVIPPPMEIIISSSRHSYLRHDSMHVALQSCEFLAKVTTNWHSMLFYIHASISKAMAREIDLRDFAFIFYVLRRYESNLFL